ncbi:MAG TPA: hypothetical protein VFW62_08920, partial [bacterium]|nr:hypothetical protein [bacterium]
MNRVMQAEREFYQARRFENQGRLQEASQLYDAVLASPLAADDPLRLSAQRRQSLLQGGGDFGDRFEFHLQNFFREATRPSAILPMLAGSAAFQASRLAVLGRFAQAPAGVLSRGLGARAIGMALPFGAELSTFVLTGHGAAAGGRDWASAAISLGLLKFSGGLAQNFARALPRSPALPSILGATSLVSGLFTAHRIEQHLGWREKTDAGTAFFESIAAAASLSLGAKLAHRLLGPGYPRTLAELELRLQQSRARLPLQFPAFAMAGGGKLP